MRSSSRKLKHNKVVRIVVGERAVSGPGKIRVDVAFKKIPTDLRLLEQALPELKSHLQKHLRVTEVGLRRTARNPVDANTVFHVVGIVVVIDLLRSIGKGARWKRVTARS